MAMTIVRTSGGNVDEKYGNYQHLLGKGRGSLICWRGEGVGGRSDEALRGGFPQGPHKLEPALAATYPETLYKKK